VSRPVLVWSDALADYDFGPQHPLAPIRLKLAIELARELGVLDGFDIVAPTALDVDELATVHERYYIAGVQEASANPLEADPMLGLGTSDNPAVAGMHETSALIAGASVEAARRVRTGQTNRAANIAGGLHHAMPNRASGFCIYNDPALAIRWMLDHGAQRVAYVDVDAHHGDGVQAIFYNDPRVMTISLHESPRTLFPGTGYPNEIGGRGAEGTAVNLALPAGTADAGWLRAFHAVVPDVIAAFRPEVVVSQHGCDSHATDPLTNLMLTIDGQRAAYLAVEELVEQYAGGRWVVTGGGGYALYDVVPRIWTHLLAIVAGRPLAPETLTPADWRATVARFGRSPALAMTEADARGEVPVGYRPWSDGHDVEQPLDLAIAATRECIFPLWALDPHA
jgi:acetoin utilization protein AcuC